MQAEVRRMKELGLPSMSLTNLILVVQIFSTAFPSQRAVKDNNKIDMTSAMSSFSGIALGSLIRGKEVGAPRLCDPC